MTGSLRFASAIALGVIVGVAAPALAQSKTTDRAIDDTLGDHTRYRRVILALQKSVIGHNRARVAELIRYPIGVSIGGKQVVIKTKKSFIDHYDRIVTPAIAEVIKKQKYDDLRVNYQGVMFGRGEVWINGICLDHACRKFNARVVTIQAGPS